MCLAQWLAYSKHSINYIFVSKYTGNYIYIYIQYQSYKYVSKTLKTKYVMMYVTWN